MGHTEKICCPLLIQKPVADLRIGILTIREKWELFLKTTTTPNRRLFV